MAEYIEREALYETLYDADAITFRGMEIFRNFPAADVAEVKHGEWKEIEDWGGDTHWQCSACGIEWYFIEGTPSENGTNFCPNCGAKMKG